MYITDVNNIFVCVIYFVSYAKKTHFYTAFRKRVGRCLKTRRRGDSGYMALQNRDMGDFFCDFTSSKFSQIAVHTRKHAAKQIGEGGSTIFFIFLEISGPGGGGGCWNRVGRVLKNKYFLGPFCWEKDGEILILMCIMCFFILAMCIICSCVFFILLVTAGRRMVISQIPPWVWRLTKER